MVIPQLFKQRHCNTKGFSLQSPIKRSLAKRSLAKHIHNCEYFRGGYKENVRKNDILITKKEAPLNRFK